MLIKRTNIKKAKFEELLSKIMESNEIIYDYREWLNSIGLEITKRLNMLTNIENIETLFNPFQPF